MAIRQIIKEGDANLRKVCKPVTEFDEKLWQLLDDMKETLAGISGLGLAAPQVNVLRRAIVIYFDGEYVEIINPVLLQSEGELLDNEGCLSIDDCRGLVKRPAAVKISYQDRNGKKHKMKREGYDARCIMHEMDHLDGILFTDRMIKRIEMYPKEKD